MISIPKLLMGLALAAGVSGAAVGASAAPAAAATYISAGVNFGGVAVGYSNAPGYHWHRWHDGYGWHRRWVPVGWTAPVAYGPRPVSYGAPGPVWYPHRDWHGGYGYEHRDGWHHDGWHHR